jgi:hypothetical protein
MHASRDFQMSLAPHHSMKSGGTFDSWSERWMIATRAKFPSIALLIPKQLGEGKDEIREVVTQFGEDCDQSRVGMARSGKVIRFEHPNRKL